MCRIYENADPGFDLYVTEDGINFETITTDGFGDPFNHGLRAYAVMDSGFYIGTANPFYGTQVWQLSETASTDDNTQSTEASSSESDKNDTSGTVNKDNSDTSPKTGDNRPNNMIVISLLVIICAFVAFAFYKKVRTKNPDNIDK